MLRKKFQRVVIPGQPERPADPGGYYCYPQQYSGTWELRCTTVSFYPPYSVAVPAGAQIIQLIHDEAGKVVVIICTVCASVFVPTWPAGPPICTYVPPREYRPYIPYSVEQRVTVGWDSGANSVQERAGDCELRWTMGEVVGVYVGFNITTGDVSDIARYSHSIFFHQRSGDRLFKVIEAGETRSFDAEYAPGDEFAIRRVGGRVSYWRNGEKLQDSLLESSGDVSAGSSFYVSGDMIP